MMCKLSIILKLQMRTCNWLQTFNKESIIKSWCLRLRNIIYEIIVKLFERMFYFLYLWVFETYSTLFLPLVHVRIILMWSNIQILYHSKTFFLPVTLNSLMHCYLIRLYFSLIICILQPHSIHALSKCVILNPINHSINGTSLIWHNGIYWFLNLRLLFLFPHWSSTSIKK